VNEDERLDLIDLLPADMNIWADDDELEWFTGRDQRWWLDVLGHPKAHPGCCKTCGCATTCMAAAFHDALIATVVRELDRLGVLTSAPQSDEHGSPSVPGGPRASQSPTGKLSDPRTEETR
jgi:hypothetical protein